MLEANRAVAIMSENASHFIRSALVEVKRDDEEGNRNAVVFVAAALEVLLKMRLAMEHWALIFDDPGRAKRADLESGDFVSVQASKLVKRLNDVAELAIDGGVPGDFFKLRNRVIHYAPPTGIAIRLEVARGLTYAVDLVHRHILAGLAGPERGRAESDMNAALDVFHELDDFKSKRLASLEPILTNRGVTVTCPDCFQEALVLDDVSLQTCLFCLTSTPGAELAQRYIGNVLHWTWRDEADGGNHPVHHCIECDSFAFVDEARVRNRAKVNYVCFACASAYEDSDIGYCDRCGGVMARSEDGTCSACWSALR